MIHRNLLGMIFSVTMAICSSGYFDKVHLPYVFPNAAMPLYACQHKVDDDTIILIYAGEPKYRNGLMERLDLVKAMMPHEFDEELERIEE